VDPGGITDETRTDNTGNVGVQGTLFDIGVTQSGGGSRSGGSRSNIRPGTNTSKRPGSVDGDNAAEPIPAPIEPIGGDASNITPAEPINIDIRRNQSIQLP